MKTTLDRFIPQGSAPRGEIQTRYRPRRDTDKIQTTHCCHCLLCTAQVFATRYSLPTTHCRTTCCLLRTTYYLLQYYSTTCHLLLTTLLTGYSNLGVAERLLERGLREMDGVVFLDGSDRKMVLLRAGNKVVPLELCAVPSDRRLTFYVTRGWDSNSRSHSP